MDALKIVVLGVAAAVCALTVKNQRPEIALTLSIAAAGLILLLALGKLGEVMSFVDELAVTYGISGEYVAAMLKVTGIALLVDMGSQLCRDAGETSVAARVELGGKCVMTVLVLPVIGELMSVVTGLIS